MKTAGRITTAALICLLVALGVAGRLLPHPPNFTPVAGVVLFAGFLFAKRSAPLAITLVVMGLSDVFIGAYEPRVMATVYAAMLLPAAFGRSLKTRFSLPRLAGGCLVASIAFYFATNLAVWAFSGFYERTSAALFQCYVNALPFFQYKLAGDAVWTTILFGAYGLATHGLPSFAPRRLAYRTAERDATGPRSRIA